MKQTRKLPRLALWLTLVLSVGCVDVPDDMDVVADFELDRYLGTWYEIARLDHRFERGMTDVTATYSLRDDGGVKVVNRGFKTDDDEWDEANGKAFFVGDETLGQLKVSFFGPFYGGYNVIKLDQEDYQYSMVAGPDRSYLWILARTPELPDAVLSDLVDTARGLGFPVDDLIYVSHDRANVQ